MPTTAPPLNWSVRFFSQSKFPRVDIDQATAGARPIHFWSMAIQSSSSKIAHFPLPQRTCEQHGDTALFADMLNAPHAPLRLIIDCNAFATLQSHDMPLSALISHELRLWSEALGPRHISGLFVLHPYTTLAPCELTEVLHAVSSRFQISETNSVTFSIVSELTPIHANHLALSKGLGFTNVQIIVNEAQLADERAIAKTVSLLREYRIESVGIQIHVADCLGDLRNSIRRIDAACQPDYICIGQQLTALDIVADKGCRYSQSLQDENGDTLALGPGANSTINGRHLSNYTAPQRYTEALLDARLPIHIQAK